MWRLQIRVCWHRWRALRTCRSGCCAKNRESEYPSFDLFVKLITMFDVSVDQFIHADGGARSSSCRKHIDVLLNSMNEKELVVIEATAEGIKKARETEVPE